MLNFEEMDTLEREKVYVSLFIIPAEKSFVPGYMNPFSKGGKQILLDRFICFEGVFIYCDLFLFSHLLIVIKGCFHSQNCDIYLSAYLPVSIHLSSLCWFLIIYLSVYLSVCLSIYLLQFLIARHLNICRLFSLKKER